MSQPTRSPLPPAIIAVVLIALLAWTLIKHQRRTATLAATETARFAENQANAQSQGDASALQKAAQRARTAAGRAQLDAFKKQLAAHVEQEGRTRTNEASLAFKDADAYHRFLDRAVAAGLTVLARSDALKSVRVHYDSLDSLAADIVANVDDLAEVAGNYLAQIPNIPSAEDRAAHPQVPVRNNLLATLGAADADNSQWGRGVTIAVLDSGVSADATFGTNRIRTLDVGYGIAAGQGGEDGHGTAVASVAAGASPDARGIAPGADLLSIRVTDASGASDMFTIAQAIVAAVDSGAQILNISLGGYGTSATLTRAIDYAVQNGAVIVAAAGNDQASQLVWPAADTRVVSVGATDAVQQQVMFSNSGWQLQITAPGYAVQAAWTDGDRQYFTGTSASSPVVAGAIAAVMSQTPGLTAQDAWNILQTHADDAGAQGRDSDYGAGVLDLGWAMGRNDSTRVDMAISSHYLNQTTSTVDVVVQNRSATAMGGATLNVDTGNGSTTSYTLPWLGVGDTTVVKVPVSAITTDASGQKILRTTLTPPVGFTDTVTGNNAKASVISAQASTGK